MYRILEQDGVLFIVESANNVIRVDGLRSLLHLRTRIEQYLVDQRADDASTDDLEVLSMGKFIDTTEARLLARENGVNLAATTLISACVAGNVDGAEKRGARWWMPADSFLRWLNRRDRSA